MSIFEAGVAGKDGFGKYGEKVVDFFDRAIFDEVFCNRVTGILGFCFHPYLFMGFGGVDFIGDKGIFDAGLGTYRAEPEEAQGEDETLPFPGCHLEAFGDRPARAADKGVIRLEALEGVPPAKVR